MSIDPDEYDLDELRGMIADGEPFVPSNGEESTRGVASPSSEAVLESNQYRELLMLQGMTDDLEKPYLSSLPDSFSAEITVFEWLEFLLGKAGFKHTLDVIRYYRSIDWITDDVEGQLREYLSGFDEVDAGESDLDRSDHVLSLVYVAKLASMQS